MDIQDVKITKKDEKELGVEIIRLLNKEDYPLQRKIEWGGGAYWIDLAEEIRKDEMQDAILKAIEKTFLEKFGNIEPEELKKRIEKENFLDEKNKGFWEFYVKIVDEIRPIIEKRSLELAQLFGPSGLADLFNRFDEVKHFFFRSLNVATDMKAEGRLNKTDEEIFSMSLFTGVNLTIQNNFFKLVLEEIKNWFHDILVE